MFYILILYKRSLYALNLANYTCLQTISKSTVLHSLKLKQRPPVMKYYFILPVTWILQTPSVNISVKACNLRCSRLGKHQARMQERMT